MLEKSTPYLFYSQSPREARVANSHIPIRGAALRPTRGIPIRYTHCAKWYKGKISTGSTLSTVATSPIQTKKIGEALAKEILRIRPGKEARIIGLVGDLGGGKTTFLQGFARGLGIKERILSPTFVIMKKFDVRRSTFEPRTSNFEHFYHIDCYRIKKPKEILDLGFKKIISDPQNIVAIEWADRIKKILPRETIWINFEFIDSKTRKIVVQLKYGGSKKTNHH